MKWKDEEFVSTGTVLGLPAAAIGGGGESSGLSAAAVILALLPRERMRLGLPRGRLRGRLLREEMREGLWTRLGLGRSSGPPAGGNPSLETWRGAERVLRLPASPDESACPVRGGERGCAPRRVRAAGLGNRDGVARGCADRRGRT